MKSSSGQSIVPIVVLLLIIVIALAFVIKTAMPDRPRYGTAFMDWTCEKCEYRFVAKYQKEPRVCPKCRGEAVQTSYYYCSVHNHIFEGYRVKPDPDWDPRAGGRMPGPMGGKLFRGPGGEWGRGFPKVTCPEGNSDPSTLEPCPLGSEKRK